MATIVAAAGGGNWQTNGTWVGGVKPTAADDAQLNATSGNVTIDSGSVCRSLDCTGYTGTLTHTAGIVFNIGDATAGAGNKALTFVAGMTYTLGSPTTSILTFISTSATQQTITWAGKIPGTINFQGAGSSYLYGDSPGTSAANLSHTDGTLNLNGKTIVCQTIAGTGSNTRTLTMGAANITITSGNWNFSTSTGLTVTANTATLTLSGSSSTFAGGTANYNGLSVVFTNTTGAINGGNTIANLTITGTASNVFSFTVGANTTITNTFTCNGNSILNRVWLKTDAVGTARTITAATVSVTNSDFMDITGAGAGSWNLSAITGLSGDCGGNSGITFTTPATQTHTTSAGGNWSDVTKWTSRVPLPQDDVIVDVNTTGTLTADMPRLGKTLTFTGFAGTLTYANAVDNFGGFILGSGTTLTPAGFAGTLRGRTTYNLNIQAQSFAGLNITAPSGTYTVQTNSIVTGNLLVTNGTLNANGFNITVSKIQTSTGTTLTLGTGTWTCLGTNSLVPWSIDSGTTINASTSTIVFDANGSAGDRTFAGGGKTYNNFSCNDTNGNNITISGANTFNIVDFSSSVPKKLILPASTTTTMSSLSLNGTGPSGLGSLTSSSSGTAATLSIANGEITCKYITLKDSTATGGAEFRAVAANALTGNTGWALIASDTDNLLVPTADKSDGTWTDQAAGTNLSAAIDETAVDDADYIQSVAGPASDVCEVYLESAVDPVSSSGHITHYRYQKNVSAGAVDLTVDLVQPAHANVVFSGAGTSPINLGQGTNTQKDSQGFLWSGAGSVGSLKVFLSKTGSPTDNVTFDIYNTSSGLPTGSSIAGGTGPAGTAITASFVEYTLTFTNPVPLLSGTYAIVLGRTGSTDVSNYYSIKGIDPGTYTDGVSSLFNGTTWSAGETFDLYFQVIGTGIVASWTHTNITNAWTTANQTLTTAQADSITDYTDLRLRFTANMTSSDAAISKVADRATVNGNTAVSTVDFVLTGLTVGNYLIIRSAADNSGTNGAARTLTVTNQSGTAMGTHTEYQQNQDPGAASAGTTLNVSVIKIAATSGTIRFTYSGTVVQAGIAEEWTGIAATTPVVGSPVGAVGTASNNLASCTDASVASGNMAYGAMAIEGPSTDTYTEDADTTNGTWISLTRAGTTNATADTNQTIAGGYKVVTATGAQTYNPTGNNTRDSAGLILELAGVAPTIRAQVSWAQLEIPAAAIARSIFLGPVAAVHRAASW